MKNQKKNKTTLFFLALTALLILSGYTIFKLSAINSRHKAALPYLLNGESIQYFKLVNHRAEITGKSALNGDKPSLIFIFSRPCSPCNKNIVYWKKMAKLLQDKADIYGIILDDAGKAFGFAEEAKLNFNIYIPQDTGAFTDAMRLRMNLSQTIIYFRGGVRKLKMGDLNGKEAAVIIKTVRSLI